MLNDLRLATRALRHNLGFSSVVVLTLALGIGLNTAIFSLMDAVMLRELPVAQPERLVLFGDGRSAGSTDDFPDSNWRLFSNPMFRTIKAKNDVFADLCAVKSLLLEPHGLIEGVKAMEKIRVQLVSGSYFGTLGVKPQEGRLLTDADDQTPGGHPVAVASFVWWQRHGGTANSVVGKSVTIGSTVYTVIGVAPPEFFGTTVGELPDLWIPLAMEAQISPGWNGLERQLFQSLWLVGRLKPDVDAKQGETNMNLLFKQILLDYAGAQASPERLERIKHAGITLTSVATGLSRMRYQFSTPLRILMAAVALVLVVSCANIANLLLARSTTRHREVAVRMAIGAGRAQVIRQLLAESILLAMIGGAFGLILSAWASKALLAIASGGPQTLPLVVGPNLRLLGFGFALSLITAVLFGAAPALRASRVDLVASLKDGRGSLAGQQRSPLAKALVVMQVAFSLLLLLGASLFMRSLTKLTNIETGFNRNGVLLFSTDAAAVGFREDGRLVGLYEQIEAQLKAVPGVTAASFSMFTFDQGAWTEAAWVTGYQPRLVRERVVCNNVVGAAYFGTMGMPLVAGRTFGALDTTNSPQVAVVNETMARRFFGPRLPIGLHFGLGGPEHANDIEVIGVVKDAKYTELREDQRPAAFFPYAQRPTYLGNLSVRFTGESRSIVRQVHEVIGGINSGLPISESGTLAEQVDRSITSQRMIAQLSAAFGLLAVFIASLGIYGLMSYTVSRRTNEIGVRMALGAQCRDVLWMVMRELLLLVGLGIIVALPLTFAGDRVLSSVLYGLSSTDPISIGIALVGLVGATTLAGYLPALRASKVDPMEALRYE